VAYLRRAADAPPIDNSATMSTITAHHAIASVPWCQVRTSHMPTAYGGDRLGQCSGNDA
jgi:hypothetical protein